MRLNKCNNTNKTDFDMWKICSASHMTVIKSSGSHKWNSWFVTKERKKLWFVFTTMLSPLWLMLNIQYVAHVILFLWSQKEKKPDNQQALLSVNLHEGYDFKRRPIMLIASSVFLFWEFSGGAFHDSCFKRFLSLFILYWPFVLPLTSSSETLHFCSFWLQASKSQLRWSADDWIPTWAETPLASFHISWR